ncbi:MAG: ABC transporter substrate-binding protein [Candidatus Dormiibacterota bacterium]
MSEDARRDDLKIDIRDFLIYRKLSRRRALQAGVGLAAGAFGVDFLAACSGANNGNGSGNAGGKTSGSPKPAGGTSVGGTPREQTVVIDQTPFTVFDSFNVFIPNGFDPASGLQQVCFEYLWYLNLVNGALTPWLATGYEYNSDFTQVTFHLNPAAHWNDGVPFTARDIQFTIQMLQKNTSLLTSGFPTAPLEVKSLSTPDDHTLVIDLTNPDPRYHYNYICGIVNGFYVLPEHIWSSQNAQTFKFDPPVLTGPYKLKNALRDQQVYVWEKDPNYWNKSKLDPTPQYAAWRSASTDKDVAFSQFKQAETDCGSDYQHVSAAISGGYKNAEILDSFYDPCERAVWINVDSPSSGGILGDYRMRWAISSLIDRERIAKSIWVPSTAPGAYPWTDYKENKKWELPSVAAKYPLAYDPKKAAQLLDEIGAKKDSSGKRHYKGQPVSLQMITPGLPTQTGGEYDIGQLITQDLKAVGIDCSLKYLASAVFQQQYETGAYDLISWWLCGEYLDPYQVYEQFTSNLYEPVGKTASAGDWSRVRDPQFDAAVHELSARKPTDPAAKPYFEQALDRWFHDMSVIPSIQSLYTFQWNTTYWTGWPTNKNLYGIPHNWWGQFMFVLGHLKPAGS